MGAVWAACVSDGRWGRAEIAAGMGMWGGWYTTSAAHVVQWQAGWQLRQWSPGLHGGAAPVLQVHWQGVAVVVQHSAWWVQRLPSEGVASTGGTHRDCPVAALCSKAGAVQRVNCDVHLGGAGGRAGGQGSQVQSGAGCGDAGWWGAGQQVGSAGHAAHSMCSRPAGHGGEANGHGLCALACAVQLLHVPHGSRCVYAQGVAHLPSPSFSPQ